MARVKFILYASDVAFVEYACSREKTTWKSHKSCSIAVTVIYCIRGLCWFGRGSVTVNGGRYLTNPKIIHTVCDFVLRWGPRIVRSSLHSVLRRRLEVTLFAELVHVRYDVNNTRVTRRSSIHISGEDERYSIDDLIKILDYLIVISRKAQKCG